MDDTTLIFTLFGVFGAMMVASILFLLWQLRP